MLTAKHHDGVALWDSKVGPLTTVRNTPAGRDLVGPFCQALRQKNLKVGLYYSLIDWSHQNYPNFLRDQKRYENDEARWQQFSRFNHAQIQELSREGLEGISSAVLSLAGMEGLDAHAAAVTIRLKEPA